MSSHRKKRQKIDWKCHIPEKANVVFRKSNRNFIGTITSRALINREHHTQTQRFVVRVKGNFMSHDVYNLFAMTANYQSLNVWYNAVEVNGTYLSKHDNNDPLYVLDASKEEDNLVLNWRQNIRVYQNMYFKSATNTVIYDGIVIKVDDNIITLQMKNSKTQVCIPRESPRLAPVIVRNNERQKVSLSYNFAYTIQPVITKEHMRDMFLGATVISDGLEGKIVDVDVLPNGEKLYCWAEIHDYTIYEDGRYASLKNIKWMKSNKFDSVLETPNILQDRAGFTKQNIIISCSHTFSLREKEKLLEFAKVDPDLALYFFLKWAKNQGERDKHIFFAMAFLMWGLKKYYVPYVYQPSKDCNYSSYKDMMLAKIKYFEDSGYRHHPCMDRYADFYHYNHNAGRILNYEHRLKGTNLFNFKLNSIKENHTGDKLHLSFDFTYNGLYSSDVIAYSATAISMNSVSIRPLFNLMFEDSITTDDTTESKALDLRYLGHRKSTLFKHADEKYTKLNKIPSLMRHQSYIVSRMQYEENSKFYLSDFFSRSINKNCEYNMIAGFVAPHPHIKSNGGFLALRTGWGKTIVMIELVKREGGKTLVVAPLSLLDQWKNEFTKFAEDLKLSEYYGKKRNIAGDVVFTTYGTLRQNEFQVTWDRVIFDESHTIKKPESITALSCYKVQAKNRWLLSATPFNDNYVHLHTQLRMLNVRPFERSIHIDVSMPFGKFMSRCVFALSKSTLVGMGINPILKKVNKTQYVDVEASDDAKIILNYMTKVYLERFKNLIQYGGSFAALRKPAQYMQLACTHPSLLPLATFANREFDADKNVTKEQLIKSIENSTVGSSSYKENVISGLQQESDGTCCICLEEITAESEPTITPCLHIFCKGCIEHALRVKAACPSCRKSCSTALLRTMVTKKSSFTTNGDLYVFTNVLGFTYSIPHKIKDAYDRLKTTVPQKFSFILKYLESCDKSCVIFSQYNSTLTALETYLLEKGQKAHSIYGSISRGRRKNIINSFMSGETKTLLLACKTASVGINLQQGGVIFFLEPMLDREEELQSIGRLHRIGQTDDITVIGFKTKDTYETTIYPFLKRQRHLLRDINKTAKGRARIRKQTVLKSELFKKILKL
jgi:superfamily II DNA or RNA helicase